MLNSVYSGNELTNGIHFRSKNRAPHVFQRSEQRKIAIEVFAGYTPIMV